jgi:hypothetical protein
MAVSRHKPTSNSGLSTPNSLASSPMSESFNENYVRHSFYTNLFYCKYNKNILVSK